MTDIEEDEYFLCFFDILLMNSRKECDLFNEAGVSQSDGSEYGNHRAISLEPVSTDSGGES